MPVGLLTGSTSGAVVALNVPERSRSVCGLPASGVSSDVIDVMGASLEQAPNKPSAKASQALWRGAGLGRVAAVENIAPHQVTAST
jgi:hypothetical protein